ncbi:hypothetical protein, partial [Acidomonas methanolica]|uniref:hypothetical protein n=1 Tax=Acidomonas methanolica TaxID=437 RepID=UPI001C9A1378
TSYRVAALSSSSGIQRRSERGSSNRPVAGAVARMLAVSTLSGRTMSDAGVLPLPSGQTVT